MVEITKEKILFLVKQDFCNQKSQIFYFNTNPSKNHINWQAPNKMLTTEGCKY